MSLGTFLGIAFASGILALGQWLCFKVFSKSVPYLPLFGSLFLTNIVMMLLRNWIS